MKAKAYIVHRAMCEPKLEWSKPKDCLSAEPLYTSPPPQRKPLTDEQIDAAVKAWFENDIVAGRQPFAKRMRAAFAAAHGIKGAA